MAFHLPVKELPAAEANVLYLHDLPKGYRVVRPSAEMRTSMDSGITAIIASMAALDEKAARRQGQGIRLGVPTESDLRSSILNAPPALSKCADILAWAVGQYCLARQDPHQQVHVALGIVRGGGIVGSGALPELDEDPAVLVCAPPPPPQHQPVEGQVLCVVWIHRSDTGGRTTFAGLRARTSRVRQHDHDGSSVAGTEATGLSAMDGKKHEATCLGAPSTGFLQADGGENKIGQKDPITATIEDKDNKKDETLSGNQKDPNLQQAAEPALHRQPASWVDVAFNYCVASPLKWILQSPADFFKLCSLVAMAFMLLFVVHRVQSLSFSDALPRVDLEWARWSDWLLLSEWDRYLGGVRGDVATAGPAATDSGPDIHVSDITGVPVASLQLGVVQRILEGVPFLAAALQTAFPTLPGLQNLHDGTAITMMLSQLASAEVQLIDLGTRWTESIIREMYELSRIRTALEEWELQAIMCGVVSPPAATPTTTAAPTEAASKAKPRPMAARKASEKELASLAEELEGVVHYLLGVVNGMYAVRQGLSIKLAKVPDNLEKILASHRTALERIARGRATLAAQIRAEESAIARRRIQQEREDRAASSWVDWVAVRVGDAVSRTLGEADGPHGDDVVGLPLEGMIPSLSKARFALTLLEDTEAALEVSGVALDNEKQGGTDMSGGVNKELEWLGGQRKTLENVVKELEDSRSAGGRPLRARDLERIWKDLVHTRETVFNALTRKHLRQPL